MQKNQVVR